MQTVSALEILLVDDDQPLRDMLTRSFEREGHRVTAVADGEAAIAQATERDVEQDDVERALLGGLERGLAVADGGHAMALALEGTRQHLPQRAVVVDQQNVQSTTRLHVPRG